RGDHDLLLGHAGDRRGNGRREDDHARALQRSDATPVGQLSLNQRWTSSGFACVIPPSTGRQTPVTKRASSLARDTAAQATAHAVPAVPRGEIFARYVRCSGVNGRPRSAIGVSTMPGAMAFARTPRRPYATAMSAVSRITAAFAAL